MTAVAVACGRGGWRWSCCARQTTVIRCCCHPSPAVSHSSVRVQVGQQARIVVPQLPLEAVPLFRRYYPLSQAIYSSWDLFEAKKRLVARELRNVDWTGRFTAAELGECAQPFGQAGMMVIG